MSEAEFITDKTVGKDAPHVSPPKHVKKSFSLRIGEGVMLNPDGDRRNAAGVRVVLRGLESNAADFNVIDELQKLQVGSVLHLPGGATLTLDEATSQGKQRAKLTLRVNAGVKVRTFREE
jgi:hypothetical protein